MANDWESAVYPHGDLIQLTENLWWVKSAQKGIPLPRNMIVYRLASGDLLLHSVVCLSEAGMAALERLGAPRYIVVPNEGHRTDAPRYKARYPQLQVFCPSGARAKVEEIIPVDATCEEALPGLGIVCHLPDGTKPPAHELVYEVDGAGGKALLFNDLLANGPKMTGFTGSLFNLLGSGGVFGAPRIVRFFFVHEAQKLRVFLERLAERQWQVITVSHGDPVTADCAAQLKQAAAKL